MLYNDELKVDMVTILTNVVENLHMFSTCLLTGKSVFTYYIIYQRKNILRYKYFY